MKLEEELKMEKFENPYHRVALNIMFTGNWLKDRVNTILKPFGLSDQQYNVLRILRGQKDKPANLFTIQERMIHRMSNATRLVEKLRLKGLVERRICEDNRRMVEITITQKGLDLLKTIQPHISENDLTVSQKLSEKEATQLADLLDKLRDE